MKLQLSAAIFCAWLPTVLLAQSLNALPYSDSIPASIVLSSPLDTLASLTDTLQSELDLRRDSLRAITNRINGKVDTVRQPIQRLYTQWSSCPDTLLTRVDSLAQPLGQSSLVDSIRSVVRERIGDLRQKLDLEVQDESLPIFSDQIPIQESVSKVKSYQQKYLGELTGEEVLNSVDDVISEEDIPAEARALPEQYSEIQSEVEFLKQDSAHQVGPAVDERIDQYVGEREELHPLTEANSADPSPTIIHHPQLKYMDLFNQKVSQDEINSLLWSACDTFRGAFDSSEYKNYILVFMFLKYLSDVWKDKQEEYRETYGDDEALIQRKMQRERFVLPKNCTFDYLYHHRSDSDIGEKIDKVLAQIEDENQEKLQGVFCNISFNSEKVGQTKDRNRRLKNLITDFAKPELNFRPWVVGKAEDVIGNAYMYLIEKFASGAGKKGGEFYTPHEVSDLLARVLRPQPGSRIYDPTCGSCYLLVSVAQEVRNQNDEPSNDYAVYGQESNGDTWALCKMNMFLHGIDAADIRWGDTLNDPKHIEAAHLMKFDIVVANPPFNLDKWGAEDAEGDTFKRYWRGVPAKSKADYAFIQHMIESTNEHGRVGLIVPHGVLFRGSAEGRIRQRLLDDNLLEVVIGLPSNLFYGTGIPAAILVFNKQKSSDNILFVDASIEYEAGKRQNRLREKDMLKVVAEYQRFRDHEAISEGKVLTDKYSYIATMGDIKENDYNLNIPRYVDTFEEEEPVDIPATQREIEQIEQELAEVQQQMKKYLAELGF